jgi:hypothetical protein
MERADASVQIDCLFSEVPAILWQKNVYLGPFS